MTASERLDHLMPWLNGDPLSRAQVRQALFAFLHKFSVAGVRLPQDAGMWDTHDASQADLDATRKKVRELIETGFWFSVDDEPVKGAESLTRDDVAPSTRFASLRFDLHRQPLPGKRSALGRRERRALAARGTYEMFVDAEEIQDLVGYLVLHLLSAPGEVSVSRCKAPAPGKWSERCGRLFVVGNKGRPREFCSGTCTTRMNDFRKEHRTRKPKAPIRKGSKR